MFNFLEDKALTVWEDCLPTVVKYNGETVRQLSAYLRNVKGTNSVSYNSEYKQNLFKMQIDGNTVQDETPTPESPIPIRNAGDLPIKCVLKTNDEDYQQVEYIESSGTQHIDTLFKANQDTRIVVDFQPLEIVASFIFGARTSAGSRSYALNIGGSPIQLLSSFGSSGNKAIELVYTTVRYKVDKNKNVLDFYSNGVFRKTETFTNTTFTTQGNVNLFACNQAGTNGYLPSKMRLYSCQMYDNGTLVRDFIPCYRKSDNKAGLFDVVNNVFYENKGTGEFKKGANVGTSNLLKKVEVEIPSSITIDGETVNLTFGTGDSLVIDRVSGYIKYFHGQTEYVLYDKKNNITTELGQQILDFVNSTQNATNLIEITSTPSVSNLSVNYAKWGGALDEI